VSEEDLKYAPNTTQYDSFSAHFRIRKEDEENPKTCRLRWRWGARSCPYKTGAQGSRRLGALV